MKTFSLILALLVVLMPVSQAGDREDKIINSLLKVGVKFLQSEQERRARKAEAREAEPLPPVPEVAEPETEGPTGEPDYYDNAGHPVYNDVLPADAAPLAPKRSWKDRGRDMVGALVSGGMNRLGDEPISKVIAKAAKEALDVLVNEYKEQYKQEGREYAKEVGDKIVGRVLNDPKIAASIYTVQALCWGVIIYLTLVTVLVVFSLLHLKRVNSKLLVSVEEMKALLQQALPALKSAESDKEKSSADSSEK